MKYEETVYGFIYGAVEIHRICSDEEEGWVTVGANTAKSRVQIYVTKTGKVRVWKDGVEMQMPTAPKKRKEKK